MFSLTTIIGSGSSRSYSSYSPCEGGGKLLRQSIDGVSSGNYDVFHCTRNTPLSEREACLNDQEGNPYCCKYIGSVINGVLRPIGERTASK